MRVLKWGRWWNWKEAGELFASTHSTDKDNSQKIKKCKKLFPLASFPHSVFECVWQQWAMSGHLCSQQMAHGIQKTPLLISSSSPLDACFRMYTVFFTLLEALLYFLLLMMIFCIPAINNKLLSSFGVIQNALPNGRHFL